MENGNVSIDKIERLLQFQKDDFKELHLAAKEDNIILFLGAGVSKIYECPLWSEMSKELVKN
jgi:hypothetical protein